MYVSYDIYYARQTINKFIIATSNRRTWKINIEQNSLIKLQNNVASGTSAAFNSNAYLLLTQLATHQRVYISHRRNCIAYHVIAHT